MPVREFFHLMVVVDDFDEAEARYAALLSPLTFDPKHWSDLDKRWASLARVGDDFVLELMETSTADEDRLLPIPKFRRRFGQHLHSMSWLVDEADQRAVLARLRSGGVRVAGPTGALLEADTEELPRVLFTHPKDTFGQIELMCTPPAGWHSDPMYQPGWSAAFWRDEHPLGILRTSHITNMVSDLDRATVVFGDLLGGTAFHATSDATAKRAYALVGTDTVVELAEPVSEETLMGRDHASSGDLPHAVTFAVRDLDRVEDHVDKVGFTVLAREGDTLTLDPSDCFGAVISFTTSAIPDDPRGPVGAAG